MDSQDNLHGAQDGSAEIKRDQTRNTYLELAAFWAVSVLIYIVLQFLAFPLNAVGFLAAQQVYLIRRGKTYFFVLFALSAFTAGCYTVFISPAIAGWMASQAQSSQLLAAIAKLPPQFTFFMNFSLVVTACGFLYVCLYERQSLRLLYKLLYATAASSAAGILVLLYLQGDQGFTKDTLAYANSVADKMKELVSENRFSIPESTLVSVSRTAFSMAIFAFFSSINFTILAFSWWIAHAAARRYFRVNVHMPLITDFRIPDRFIWLLIIVLGGVLAGFVLNVQTIGVVSLNLMFVALCVYSIQGLAITRHYISKSPALSQAYRYLPFVVLILLFTASFIFPLLILLLSGLGISDIWLHYRERNR